MATSRTSRRDYTLARKQLLARQDPCHLCGEPIDYELDQYHPQAFQADHIIPYSKGGSNKLSNLAAAHKLCNALKSNKSWSPSQNKRSMRDW